MAIRTTQTKQADMTNKLDYTFLGQGQACMSRSSSLVKGIGQGDIQSMSLNVSRKEKVINMNVKMNGSNELYIENGFQGKLLRNFKDFEIVTSLTVTKEVFQILGRTVTEKSILLLLENANREKFSATVQAYKINQDEMVLKFANRISLNLDFYTMVISRNGKYLSDKDKQIILKGFDVPMTDEEKEERRIQGLYKDFVDYEVNERFIHPENVQSFELWLSYTYPRQLAKEKAKLENASIDDLQEKLNGKKAVKA